MSDPLTVRREIERLQKEFGFGQVVFVGDRGMVVKCRIEDLRKAGFSWITALRAKDIQRLRDDGLLQLGLFDERNLAEVYASWFPGERLIVCRNPLVAEERRRKRQELLSATTSELAKIKERVNAGRLKKAEEIALRVGKVVSRWRMANHIELVIDDGRFEYRLKEEQVAREAEGVFLRVTDGAPGNDPAEQDGDRPPAVQPYHPA